MKRNIICACSCLGIIFISNICTFHLTKEFLKDRSIQTHTIESNVIGMDAISMLDYPLIDIYFDKEYSWDVLIRQNMYAENEAYYILDDREILETNKELLKVLTFPSGRGTTPNGEISVYKNNQLIKTVEYFELDVASEEFKREFTKITSKDVLEKFE
ncbi:MAG: hypothetical protein J6A69_03730 [Clostridia bacterium]|nr:hypothetical protein [Clostridia bacterium]